MTAQQNLYRWFGDYLVTIWAQRSNNVKLLPFS
jgi:hypothetical protein